MIVGKSSMDESSDMRAFDEPGDIYIEAGKERIGTPMEGPRIVAETMPT